MQILPTPYQGPQPSPAPSYHLVHLLARLGLVAQIHLGVHLLGMIPLVHWRSRHVPERDRTSRCLLLRVRLGFGTEAIGRVRRRLELPRRVLARGVGGGSRWFGLISAWTHLGNARERSRWSPRRK